MAGSRADESITNYFCNPGDADYKAIPYPIVDGGRLVRGSGTSQAAAAASGAVALMLQKFPNVTPDVLRLQLRQSAAPIPNATRGLSGEGALDIVKAGATTWPAPGNTDDAVVGGAPIALTRNGDVLVDQVAYDAAYAREYPVQLAYLQRLLPASSPEVWAAFANALATNAAKAAAALDGENDIFGKPFNSVAHAAMLDSGQKTWTMTPEGEVWNGSVWIGNGFVSVPGSPWAMEWAGAPWTAPRWSLTKWRSDDWLLVKWRDNGWELVKWRDSSWASIEWR